MHVRRRVPPSFTCCRSVLGLTMSSRSAEPLSCCSSAQCDARLQHSPPRENHHEHSSMQAWCPSSEKHKAPQGPAAYEAHKCSTGPEMTTLPCCSRAAPPHLPARPGAAPRPQRSRSFAPPPASATPAGRRPPPLPPPPRRPRRPRCRRPRPRRCRRRRPRLRPRRARGPCPWHPGSPSPRLRASSERVRGNAGLRVARGATDA